MESDLPVVLCGCVTPEQFEVPNITLVDSTMLTLSEIAKEIDCFIGKAH
jgi:hypothetical protein